MKICLNENITIAEVYYQKTTKSELSVIQLIERTGLIVFFFSLLLFASLVIIEENSIIIIQSLWRSNE